MKRGSPSGELSETAVSLNKISIITHTVSMVRLNVQTRNPEYSQDCSSIFSMVYSGTLELLVFGKSITDFRFVLLCNEQTIELNC